MTSLESTAVAPPESVSKVSRPEINNAVKVGEALGAIWQIWESSNNPFTLKWDLIEGKWFIIATYDSDRDRDPEAEETFYAHSGVHAPFAEAIIFDADGDRLEELQECCDSVERCSTKWIILTPPKARACGGRPNEQRRDVTVPWTRTSYEVGLLIFPRTEQTQSLQ